MYYYKELLSCPVLSLFEGELIGKVNKLYLDKKLKKLLFVEILSDNDTKFLLSTKHIFHIGKNAITIRNNQCVNIKVEDGGLYSSPIGLKAYSFKGEFLGTIEEISFNEKFLTETITLDNSSLLKVENVASVGTNAVIFYNEKTNINISKFTPQKTPKIFKTELKQKVQIQPTEIIDATQITPSQPQNTDFLIGRVCTKDIFNFNNELLIKAHSSITKKHLKEINKFGKIKELMLYTK